MLETFIQEVILAEDKIIVTLALVITCISVGWRIRDEGSKDTSWVTRGLTILMFILLLALAS
tara:strand:+ start:257 stop:442 length:186 start_codon:yes stop_codon:yes gene_type:complete